MVLMQPSASSLCLSQPSDPHLVVFCDLLHVSAQELCRWLCSRRIVLVMETVVKPVPQERAVSGRDALAKQIYAHLFDCVIHKINKVLKVPGIQHAFIGVLDIYGYDDDDDDGFQVLFACCFSLLSYSY